MLANQNKIIAIGILAVLLSGGLVGAAFKKALEGTDLGVLNIKNNTLTRSSKTEDVELKIASPTSGSPVISISSIPTTIDDIGTSYEEPTNKPVTKKAWEYDKPILPMKVIAVSERGVTVEEGDTNYLIRIGDSVRSNRRITLVSINSLVRELTFSVDGQNVIAYY
jgi:hypothetical protein